MSDIQTWKHSRKGIITGRVVDEDDEWVRIELHGDQPIIYQSESRGPESDGEILTARKSFLTLIKEA